MIPQFPDKFNSPDEIISILDSNGYALVRYDVANDGYIIKFKGKLYLSFAMVDTTEKIQTPLGCDAIQADGLDFSSMSIAKKCEHCGGLYHSD